MNRFRRRPDAYSDPGYLPSPIFLSASQLQTSRSRCRGIRQTPDCQLAGWGFRVMPLVCILAIGIGGRRPLRVDRLARRRGAQKWRQEKGGGENRRQVFHGIVYSRPSGESNKKRKAGKKKDQRMIMGGWQWFLFGYLGGVGIRCLYAVGVRDCAKLRLGAPGFPAWC